MAHRDCQLMLVVEPGAGGCAQLAAALEAGPVASILIADGDDRAADGVQALVKLGQGRNIAVLIADDADLARRVGADGVHLSAGPDLLVRYAAARAAVGPQGNVGVDAGGSRHDAMEVAEAGADYVAFGASAAGEPVLDDDGAAMDELDGLPTSRDEFIAWWSEVFEVACVALDVGTADEARAAAGAGADFVAVAIAATTTPDEAAGRVRAIAQAIGGGGRA